MVAAAQTGAYKVEDGSTRLTYGHSLIADPWGHVICKASDGVGFTTGRIDTAYIEKCRKLIPVLEHKVLGTPAMPVAGRGGVGSQAVHAEARGRSRASDDKIDFSPRAVQQARAQWDETSGGCNDASGGYSRLDGGSVCGGGRLAGKRANRQ